MPRLRTSDSKRRFQVAMALLIAGLIVSGVTAFPLLWEMKLLAALLGLDDAISPVGHEGLANWILTVRFGLEDMYGAHPWIAYGTDWLGFAHLAIALFFIGPLLDPLSGRANILAGMATCVGTVPLALVAGAVRGVPLASRLIDCAFGVAGFALLLYCLSLLPRIAEQQATDCA